MSEKKCYVCGQIAIDTNSLDLPVCFDHLHGSKKEALLRQQLDIATDLGDKRWKVLNEIYEKAEKKNTNWCKRKAAEGLGLIKNVHEVE